ILNILGHIKVQCCWCAHGSCKYEERNQQKSQVHHWCHIHSCRKLFSFFYTRAFFVTTITSTGIYTCHKKKLLGYLFFEILFASSLFDIKLCTRRYIVQCSNKIVLKRLVALQSRNNCFKNRVF